MNEMYVEWHVFFADADVKSLPWWFKWFTKPGMRHVFAMSCTEEGIWIVVDPSWKGTQVLAATPLPEEEILQELYRIRPWTKRYRVRARIGPEPVRKRALYTCVEVVRHLLGIQDLVYTPAQLEKVLVRNLQQ